MSVNCVKRDKEIIKIINVIGNRSPTMIDGNLSPVSSMTYIIRFYTSSTRTYFDQFSVVVDIEFPVVTNKLVLNLES